ncbi:bric a brac 2 [Carabus blaptoides fortunei]
MDEVNEAVECTQRLMDILRGAIKRSETGASISKNDSDVPNSSIKDDKTINSNNSQKEKSLFKSANNSCIDVLLNHTGVADILKRYKQVMAMGTTEQFSLRWNNFHSNLTTGFHDLLEAEDLVDVTLAAEGHVLHAHKIVLSVCSPYFKQLFKVNPCKHPIVILKDVGHSDLKDILEFMYLGEVNVLRENLTAFLKTAELLQVKGLTGDDSSETSSKKDEECVNNSTCQSEDIEEISYTHSVDTKPTIQQESYEPKTDTHYQSNSKRSKSLLGSNNFKRRKSENATYSQKFDEEDEAEDYIEIEDPKIEPLEYISENENVGMKDDNLVHLLENQKNSFGNISAVLPDGNVSDQDVLLHCPDCGRMFRREDSLRKHITNIHGTHRGPFHCNACGKAMKNKNSLNVHTYRFHRMVQSKYLGNQCNMASIHM